MLFRSSTRVRRCGVVVSRIRKAAAGIPERGVALPTLRRSDSASGTKWKIHLFLPALPEIGERIERGVACGRASCKRECGLRERIGSELTDTEKT